MKEDEGRCREMKFERKMRRNEGKGGEKKRRRKRRKRKEEDSRETLRGEKEEARVRVSGIV